MILALVQGCAATPYNPFRTSSQDVRARVRTIALAPVVVPASLADREAVRAALEPMVTKKLEAGGFKVLPPAQVEEFWRRAANDVGDVFDPVTGVVDKERYATVESAVFRELGTERGVDAVLRLKVAAVVIDVPGSYLTYCGLDLTEPIYWPVAGALDDPATFEVVLCLNAALYDLEGRELYAIRHGLQQIETYAQQTRAVRPIGERLRQSLPLSRAVEATVGPLANAGSTAK